jgi:hypothetical protein
MPGSLLAIFHITLSNGTRLLSIKRKPPDTNRKENREEDPLRPSFSTMYYKFLLYKALSGNTTNALFYPLYWFI